MKKSKIIGSVFSIIALVFSVIFIIQMNFSIHLQSYFSLQYYMQFGPLIISVMLLFGGIYLFFNHSKANLTLALFGHTALEEILFDWIGITTTLLPDYAIAVFLPCSIIALWVAYNNVFNLKRLSVREVIFTLVIGAVESLLPIII